MKSGDKVSTGSLIMRFEVAGAAQQLPANSSKATSQQLQHQHQHHRRLGSPAPTAQAPQSNNNVSGLNQEQVEASTGYAHATPVIRRLAREFGVNLE